MFVTDPPDISLREIITALDAQSPRTLSFPTGCIPYPLRVVSLVSLVSLLLQNRSIRDNIVCMRKTKDTRIHKGSFKIFDFKIWEKRYPFFLSAIFSLVIPLEG